MPKHRSLTDAEIEGRADDNRTATSTSMLLMKREDELLGSSAVGQFERI